MARLRRRAEPASDIPGVGRYRLITLASMIGAFVLGLALASALLALWPTALRDPSSASVTARLAAGGLVGLTLLILLALWLCLEGWISRFSRQAQEQIALLARKRQRQISLQQELRTAGAYIDVMNRQLKAILAQSEFGVVALIGRLQAVVDASRREVDETFTSLHEGLRMHEQLRHRMEALLEELQPGEQDQREWQYRQDRQDPQDPHAPREPQDLHARRDWQDQRRERDLQSERNLQRERSQKVSGCLPGGNVLSYVIAELAQMDGRFRASSAALFGVMKSINSNSRAVRLELSDALERIQHHDVTQQRLGQVEVALQGMCDHLRGLTALLDDPAWDGTIETPLQERLNQQVEAYVMESQRHAHAMAAGLQIEATEAPAVELF